MRVSKKGGGERTVSNSFSSESGLFAALLERACFGIY